MGDVFVRRTTGLLLSLVVLLTIVCVALLALLLRPSEEAQAVKLPQEYKHVFPNQNEAESSSSDNSNEFSTMGTDPLPKSDEGEMPTWEKNIRIPKSTIPIHYDLLLHPDMKSGWFKGNVSIHILVTSPMNYLLTHVKQMNVTHSELVDSSGQNLELENVFEYKPNEFWVVVPKNILSPGNYTLSLQFNGPLKGHIVGFYMSEYLTKSGERRSIVSSKFQPTDARRAFPCFDEPSFKSTFKVFLVRPSEGYVALSNMPSQKEIPENPMPGLTTVEFETSVPMVTYLACFIVCDFEYVEAITKNNKPFRVYATSDQVARASYARDIGVNILNYFEEYFEIDYVLPKQDMIAIPDFISGAMEHWGLITYRETNLLYDDTNSSSKNKQRVAAVISHELSHMWFGNLVTMEWWDDLWLNEGFASYIEYKGVANYEKDWDMLSQFLVNDLHGVFQLDQILSSHPIVQPVSHPNEITEIFDRISYSKGASVLRMLENFLGENNFRIGVRNFLRKFQFRNAVTQDLWNELQRTSSKELNITRVMDTWTKQMGFPVLNVQMREGDQTKLEVRQERFLIDPEAKSADDSPFSYKWDIPVTFYGENLPRRQEWFMMEKNMIVLDRPSESKWVKLNIDQYGYYRVNYDLQMWRELINVLKTSHESLSPSDRANLIDDSFSLAAADKLPYSIPFHIIAYLSKETHLVPWAATYNHLHDIGNLLQNTAAYKFFRRFVTNIVDKLITKVGWDDQGTHMERQTRVIILRLGCTYGHRGSLEEATRRFNNWIHDSNYFIPANLRTLIYPYGIKGTGELEWDVLFERYQSELNAQEKRKMLRGLTSTTQLWIANRLMELGKNETIVRRQDFFSMLSYLAYNPSTLPSVWNFVRDQWRWMVDIFGLNDRYLGRMVKTVGEQFSLPLQLKEIQTFFEENPNAGSGERARRQAIEKITQNIKWIKAYSPQLHSWLKTNI